jgi:hypothetical protein
MSSHSTSMLRLICVHSLPSAVISRTKSSQASDLRMDLAYCLFYCGLRFRKIEVLWRSSVWKFGRSKPDSLLLKSSVSSKTCGKL